MMKKSLHLISIRLLITLILCSLSKGVSAQDIPTGTWENLAEPPKDWDTNPYPSTISIFSAAELAWVAKMVNNDTETGNDKKKGFEGVTINLMTDLDLAGHLWIPIGKDEGPLKNQIRSERKPFKGTFNGNDHKIENMNISTTYMAGLFGMIENSQVSNIQLTNSKIEKGMDNLFIHNNLRVGGIAGLSSTSSTIENCSVQGDITFPKAEGGSLGGIVGLNDGGGIITNCHFEGSLSSTKSEKNMASASIGGITGGNSKNGTIEGCTAKINISSEDGGAGGITCANSSIIQKCQTEGTITVTNKRLNNGVGGIAANNNTEGGTNSLIKECSSSCDIHMTYIASGDNTSSKQRYVKVGGIIGWNPERTGSITDCSASGTIIAELITESDPPSSEYACFAGGIVGLNLNQIINCEASVNVSAFTNIPEAEAYAAGIAGGLAGTIKPGQHAITNCKAEGTVSANGSITYAAGITGLSYSDIIDCHSDVSIIGGEDKKRSNILPISTYVGGIVGQIGESGDSKTQGTIKNCSMTGRISAQGEECHAGGIAGINYRTIESSYTTAEISIGGNNNYIGGIAGDNAKIPEEATGGCILNCYSTGNITSSGETSNVGGIAGLNEYEVLNCFATGKVEAINAKTKTKSSPEGYVGGIVGMNKKTVKNCLALNLAGIASYTTTTGRIIGNNDGKTTTDGNKAHPKIPGEWDAETEINGSDWDYKTIPFDPVDAWDFTDKTQLPLLKKINSDGISYSDEKVENQPNIPLLNLQYFTITFNTPDNGTLTVVNQEDDTPISSGEKVLGGTKLTITAEASEGFQLDKIKINEETFISGEVYTVSSDITIAVTITEEKPEPTPDPEPDPTPKPDPDPTPTVYHTVTLPQIEGATTDPVAGEYEVEAWSSFRFYLTLDEAYSQSSPIVTTDRSETITPRSSDGAYIIKYVRQPIAISIDGIIKNPDPVANETIDANSPKVWTKDSYLHLQTPQPETVFIYTFNGTLLKKLTNLSGNKTLWLPQGNYIVLIGKERFKVQVK